MTRRCRADAVFFVCQTQPLASNGEAPSRAEGKAQPKDSCSSREQAGRGPGSLESDTKGDSKGKLESHSGREGGRERGRERELQSFPLPFKATPSHLSSEGGAQCLALWSDGGSSSAYLEGAEPIRGLRALLRDPCEDV